MVSFEEIRENNGPTRLIYFGFLVSGYFMTLSLGHAL